MSAFLSRLATAGAAAVLASVAAAQTTLFDTGTFELCIFNGASTYLGWTSGDASATQTQRWTPQPFTLPAGNWNITEIAPLYFVPAGNPTTMGWTIWSRNGQAAPVQADEVASGTLAFSAASAPFPVNLNLSGGDYYLSIYAVAPQGNTVGWYTNAQNGIHFLDPTGVPFMWRASTYPAPGFSIYQLAAATLSQTAGLDPNKLYCAAFAIRGDLAPATYCTAGTTSSGCNASITSAGSPSASAGSGFTLSVGNVEGSQSGIIFYGVNNTGFTPSPWGSGTSFLCVKSPLERMGVQNAGGTAGACDGVLSVDWNAYIAGNPGAVGNPFAAGNVVYAQGWFRDPPSPKTTSLSNGLQFTVNP